MIPTAEAIHRDEAREPTTAPPRAARADLHCHSTASEVSRLGVQRSLGLPECATPPEEVYELAKRRGMDLVTITDHDTIDGCLALGDRPDCFVSEELTAWFRGEPQAVHVLCYGITPEDHEWLQASSADVEACAGYLRDREIACALAHPFYSVAAPLTPRHRRRLAELFPVWEVRNGSRAPELNLPAAIYIETRGGIGIGGSDDHAGVDIGRTFTEVGGAATPEEFLAGLRDGRASAHGDQGSAAKWAHAAIALASRTVARGAGEGSAGADPRAVLRIAERVIREGGEREGEVSADVTPADARALLEAWLASVAPGRDGMEFVAWMQEDGFSHSELYRRARRRHAAGLSEAVRSATAAVGDGDLGAAWTGLFQSAIPVVPYAPAVAFLTRERKRLPGRGDAPPRVAVIADGIGSVHGVTRTIQRIREHGVPGFETEVVGTDPEVDRRLPSAAELAVPFSEGMVLGVPGLTDMVETLAEGGYDLLHVTAPGPAGIAATLLAKVAGLPLVGSYHTEFVSYAGLHTADEGVAAVAGIALGAFYCAPDFVLSPSAAADGSLAGLGREPDSIGRWERGVDTGRFAPERRQPGNPDRVSVLYAGRLAREKGVGLLADAFLEARHADPRLHLVLAGGGPEEPELRGRLGDHATFLGWLDGDDLANAYASADIFLFASSTDTFGQVIVEAGASGLPVVAVDEGGPAGLVEHGRTGLLCPGDAERLASAVVQLAASARLRRRLGRAAATAARARTWDRSMEQLADGYRQTLARVASEDVQAARRQAA